MSYKKKSKLVSYAQRQTVFKSYSVHLFKWFQVEFWAWIYHFLLLLAGLTMFVAITFPFFGGLLSFFGGFAFAPTTYFVSHNPSQFLMIYLPRDFEPMTKSAFFFFWSASLRNVAGHLQTKKVRLILVDELGKLISLESFCSSILMNKLVIFDWFNYRSALCLVFC